MSQFQPSLTHRLQELMRSVGVSSFKALSQRSGVSERQILQLRRGNLKQLRLHSLWQLAETLHLSLPELIAEFSESFKPAAGADKTALQQEYQRLQTQLEQQQHTLEQTFQKTSLQILESWMLQFPTAAYAAQQNPQLPAARLLPLMRPIEQLLKHWGIEAIGTVGEIAPYDPQRHQLLEGSAEAGEPVKIRYVGYRQAEQLLHRAKVSSVGG